jgi:hypothetical protein
MTPYRRLIAVAALLLCSTAAAHAASPIDRYDVAWDSPSVDSRGSMPLGNGDIGLNVWVEKGGDLLFYLSKTDAWSDNVYESKGLLKLGRIRVRFSPNPFAEGNPFRQTLRLADGEILITAGPADAATTVRLWADANRPVVQVEAASAKPLAMTVRFESLRPAPEKDIQADTVLEAENGRIAWYYRNRNRNQPRLTNLTFGAIVRGDGLVSRSSTELGAERPAVQHCVRIYPYTAQTATPKEWLARVERRMAEANSVLIETARQQHRQWWREFWDRSWIFADGTAEARQVTQGYVLQRFVSACAGRGAFPIKFNGSIFTMDWHKVETVQGVRKETTLSADQRDWGGMYWFQNTRCVYWPMLQSGDFEMMRPLFRMYQGQLPGNAKAIREFYGHGGAHLAETNPFWGELGNAPPERPGSNTVHYFTPILELSAMMLDYFAYTGNREFVSRTLLPVADVGVTFFDGHFEHENGKLVLFPDNAIETYWKCRNPAPDVAGLHWVLGGLLALPADLTSAEQRTRWQKLLAAIPELPIGQRGGVKVLLPAEVFGELCNTENPELYSIYPFRVFGLGKPRLELARATFAARWFKDDGCWCQNGIQAALLGDVKTARKNVGIVLTPTRKDEQCRFPAFWEHGNDYVPDEDNGGNGMNALQRMLLQGEGRPILLLPAWPKQWDCSFKLHAPLQTTVAGRIRGGQIESLRVEPRERLQDVELLRPDGSLYKYALSANGE